MNKGPTLEQAGAAVTPVRELRLLLASDGNGADTRVINNAWTHLAAACAAIASAEWLESNEAIAQLVFAVLLEAANHDEPRPSSKREQGFEEHGGISSTPRWHAARGLLNLARFPSLATPELLDAIRRLGEDACADVRSEVATHLGAIYRTERQTFWQLLRRVESTEVSPRVIHDTLYGVRQFARYHPNEMKEIAHTVFQRFRNASDASAIRCECLSIVLAASRGGENPYGDELIGTVISDMAGLTAEAVHLVQTASELLNKGPLDPPDAQWDNLRLSSFAFVHGIARAVKEWLEHLESQLQGIPRENWPVQAQPHIDAAHQIARELGIRIYFASGAFDDKMEQRGNRQAILTVELRRRFFREANLLLGLIAELGFPEVVHNVLETYSAYVPSDPRSVFLSVARAVRHGQVGGYEFESLAAGLVVGVVRRYIADYRPLFREDRDCRDALIEMLNIFVRAGWPEAIDLTIRLDEVFR